MESKLFPFRLKSIFEGKLLQASKQEVTKSVRLYKMAKNLLSVSNLL